MPDSNPYAFPTSELAPGAQPGSLPAKFQSAQWKLNELSRDGMHFRVAVVGLVGTQAVQLHRTNQFCF